MTNIDINNYKITLNNARDLFYILNLIPIRNIKEYELPIIKRLISKIYNFITLKEIRKEDIKEINELTKFFSIDFIYEYFLDDFEKSFCEKEINKYIENPEKYTVPKLDLYIDNADFLSIFINYKINNTNENNELSKNLRK